MVCVAGSEAVAQPATGPLRASSDNPRYFADSTGKIVYLTGSHTWSNLKDMGSTDPPPEFEFAGYLDMLGRYHHNFIRLWTWELSRYAYGGKPTYAAQFPWPRTGPGTALDGKARFDLRQLDQAYFDRLRAHVIAAGERGIYVSIMLFEGHGLHASEPPWCWDGHPFNVRNNVNGVDGDPDGDGRGLETQSLLIPEVTEIQEAYVRKVVDTVSDLDNVLYEIANESGAYSTDWQYHFIRFIHEYERGKPKQHPVGMTFQYCHAPLRGTNQALSDSPADWVSPSPDGGYRDNPPAADGSKVILTDTDHLWGIGGNQAWVWKSFCRGLNPLFMDPYLHDTFYARPMAGLDPEWDPVRNSLGHTRRYAERMDLAKARPSEEIASSGYCLAVPGEEYLVYLPEGGSVTVDLSAVSGQMTVEWFDPSQGRTHGAQVAAGGDRTSFQAPFAGDAVLYLKRR